MPEFLHRIHDFLHKDDAQLFRSNSDSVQIFFVYLEYVLLIYTFFVLGLWIAGYFFVSLPHYFFDFFYNSLWGLVVADFILRLFLVKNIIGYLRNEWFSLFIILFPVLQPLRVFGVSRFVILVFSKLIYARFRFIRESRVLEILLISTVVSILSADLFLLFESELPGTHFTKFSDALWFSVVTVATVGYGDIVPISIPGRILATLLIVFGVSVFGLLTATISSYLITRKMKSKSELKIGSLFDIPMLQMNKAEHDEYLDKRWTAIEERLERIEDMLQKK